MKTKVLYLAIVLVTVFSLISLPNINENIRQLSDIDITQIAKGENSSTTG